MKDEIENIGQLLLEEMYLHGFSKFYEKDLTLFFPKRRERDIKDAVKFLFKKGLIKVFGFNHLSHNFFLHDFSGHITDLGVLNLEANEKYNENKYSIEILRFLQVIDESNEESLHLDKIIPRLKQKGSIKTEGELKDIICTSIEHTCNVNKISSGGGLYVDIHVNNNTSPITDIGMNLIQDYIKKTKIFTNPIITNRDIILKEYNALEILIRNELWKDACIKMGSILEYLLTKWLEYNNETLITHSQNKKQNPLGKAQFYDKIRFYIEKARIKYNNEIGDKTQWEIVDKVIREYRNYIHLQKYEKRITLDGYLDKNDFELLKKPFNQILDYFQ